MTDTAPGAMYTDAVVLTVGESVPCPDKLQLAGIFDEKVSLVPAVIAGEGKDTPRVCAGSETAMAAQQANRRAAATFVERWDEVCRVTGCLNGC